MPSKYELCQQCGAILKTSVCLRCGTDASSNAEIDNLDENSSEPIQTNTEHKQVQSLFADMVTASGPGEAVEVVVKTTRRYIFPAVLTFMLFALAGASYWRFVYFTPDYVSPLVLSASDVKAAGGAVSDIDETAAAADGTEKTVDLNSELAEGNFGTLNFAQFASPDTKALVQAFDIKNIFSKFGKEEKLKDIQNEFSVSDDDLDVYFTKDIAFYAPNDNLDTWGFAIGVKDKEYAEKRLEQFAKDKDNKVKKYIYADYSADIVTVVKNDKGEEAAKPTIALDAEEADSKKTDEKKDEKADETKDTDSDYYLLISNSNEYLDQMRESAEGSLSNLAKDLKYGESKADLPQIGAVLVYKDKDSNIWNTLVDVASSRYSYVGLDKVLKAIQSTGSVFYSVDSKLKIISSQN